MTLSKTLFLSPLCLFLFLSSCNNNYHAFDPHPPGETPERFAEHLIAANNEHVGYCAFSPDGKELYYAITNDDWAKSKILRISADNPGRKDTMYLKDRNYEGEPFITRDNKTMYFMAVLPPKEGEIWNANQYRVRRNDNGWSSPELLDTMINSKASEWHVSMTDNNVMYFTSEREEGTSALHGDIYRMELVNDKFVNRTKLPAPINTKFNDSDPLIAPDESFLIFHSDRPGGFGEHDLYITFNENGKWSAPVNMGATINTPGWEMAPSLTPDGKYFLFTRRKAMVTSEPAQIFWVAATLFSRYGSPRK